MSSAINGHSGDYDVSKQVELYADAVVQGDLDGACRLATTLLDESVVRIGTETNPFPTFQGREVLAYSTETTQDQAIAVHGGTHPEFVSQAADEYAYLRMGLRWGDNHEPPQIESRKEGRYRALRGVFQAYTASRQVGRAAVAGNNFAARIRNGHIMYGMAPHSRAPEEALAGYFKRSGYHSPDPHDVLFPFELVTPHLSDPKLPEATREAQAIAFGRIGEACLMRAGAMGLIEIGPDLPGTGFQYASRTSRPRFGRHYANHPNFGGNVLREQAAKHVDVELAGFAARGPRIGTNELAILEAFTAYYRKLQVLRAQAAAERIGQASINRHKEKFLLCTPDGDLMAGKCAQYEITEVMAYLTERNYKVTGISC